MTPVEIWPQPRNRSWNFRYPCPWTILISGPVDFCLIKLNRSKNPRPGSTHQVQRDPNLGPWLVLVYVLNLRAGRGLSTGLVTKWSVDPWFEVLFEGQNCRFKWGSMVSRAHSWWLYDWNLIGGMSLFISTLPDYNQLIKIALWLPVKYLQYISA